MGGGPPTDRSQGGCSYIDAGDVLPAEPNTWPGFLARNLNVTSLLNTACGSHGNILVTNSILEILNKFNYNPKDTLIIFNLSDPARLDLPCASNGPFADVANVLWDSTIIDYSYLKMHSDIVDKIQIYMGIDQVEKFTSNAVELLITLLEYRKFDYYFMMMGNYINHQYLGPIIEKYNNRLISFTPGVSMIDFCRLSNNNVSNEDDHPSINGHKIIADIIYEHINSL